MIERERNAMRVIVYQLVAYVAAAILLALLIVCATGCASVDMERLDKLSSKWKARLEEYRGKDKELPPAEEPGPGPDKPVAGTDDVEYGSLNWTYGGFNGAKARLDSPRISNLRSNGKELWYKWDVGLGGWGLSHSEAGAVCAVFFYIDGKWIGGKFDWVSTSRSHRELKHVETYSNWPSSGIRLPFKGRVAFVAVSANGARRSNVVVAEAK